MSVEAQHRMRGRHEGFRIWPVSVDQVETDQPCHFANCIRMVHQFPQQNGRVLIGKPAKEDRDASRDFLAKHIVAPAVGPVPGVELEHRAHDVAPPSGARAQGALHKRVIGAHERFIEQTQMWGLSPGKQRPGFLSGARAVEITRIREGDHITIQGRIIRKPFGSGVFIRLAEKRPDRSEIEAIELLDEGRVIDQRRVP